MDATVVIPTLNARSLLASVLDSLANQTQPVRVIVVDNASSDGTAAMIERDYPWVRLVCNSENLGFGRAINRVALDLDGDALVLVNNDCVCEPTFVEHVLHPLDEDGVGMVAGVLLRADATSRIDSAGLELDLTLGAWDYLSDLDESAALAAPDPVGPCGGAAAFRLDAFKAVGGFDEVFFAYWEDVDLALRLGAAGWSCRLAAKARAVHRHGATLGAASPTARRLHQFGRGYVLACHAPRSLRRVLAVALLDWPALLGHLVVRRELGPLQARREGARIGRARRRELAYQPVIAVGLGTALARQAAFLVRRIARRLPAHFYRGPQAAH